MNPCRCGYYPDRKRLGARRCSPYGKKAALALSSLLAKNHIPVVSGLALGIDGFSHEGALLEGDM